MNLAQCAATAHKCDRTNGGGSRKDLEQVPGSIVEEKDTLESNQRSNKDGVWERGRFEGSRQVVDVSTEEEPLDSV